MSLTTQQVALYKWNINNDEPWMYVTAGFKYKSYSLLNRFSIYFEDIV